MSFVYGLSAVSGVILILLYMSKYRWEIKLVDSAILLAVIAFAIRILACFVSDGFVQTVNTYKNWSDLLCSEGLRSFQAEEMYTGFQPGYVYVLYLLGHIRHFFRIPDGFAHTMLIKMPAIIMDCAISVFIYRVARRKSKKQTAWLISLFWALNPASVFISSVWGQTDSIYLIFLLIAVYRLTTGNYSSSFVFYALSLLLRPQAVIFMPLFIYAPYDYIKNLEDASFKDIMRFLDKLFPALFIIICAILPFSVGFNLEPVFKQFGDAFRANPYIVMNGANLHALMGFNWVESSHMVFGIIPHGVLTMSAVMAVMLASFIVLHKNRRDDRYFFTAAFISVTVFMLGAKMNERSLLPVAAFLLASLAVRFKDEYLFMYCAFCLSIFANCAAVMNIYLNYTDVSQLALPLGIIGIVNIGLTIFFIAKAYGSIKHEKQWRAV